MPEATDVVKVERLLLELYAKKQWLDIMITSLEHAMESPDYQFIHGLETFFGKINPGLPKVDLRPQQQARLVRLAKNVARRRQRGPQKDTVGRPPPKNPSKSARRV